MGVQIRTIVKDNVATRCDGCRELIEGTPWRINLLDIVATERAGSWTDRPAINPGPFQFHSDPARVRTLDGRQAATFLPEGPRSARSCDRCRSRATRPRWGLCDGLHRDAHEFVPA